MKTLLEEKIPAFQDELHSLKRVIHGGDESDDVGIKGELKNIKKDLDTTLIPQVKQTYRAMLLVMGGLAALEIAVKFFGK